MRALYFLGDRGANHNMNQVFYALPWYFEEIASRLSEKNWLVHSFKTSEDSEIYNPSNYLYNAEYDNTKYVLALDLNVYQFLLNIVKKPESKEQFRDAAALLVFCQISNIEIDPTFSVYEKVNYEKSNLADALPDLELFHNINNADMEELARFALGYSDSVLIKSLHSIDYTEVGGNLMKYEKLKEWDSLYLMVLVITDIKMDSSIPRNRKLDVFIDWVISEFRMSLVAIVYAIVLFGKSPIKRMMKYSKSHTTRKRRWAISNMTWDLYIMNQFFRRWTGKSDNEEFMFASDDKAFCSLLRAAIEIKKHEDFEPIKSFLSPLEYSYAKKILEADRTSKSRVYNSDEWTPDYRSGLINKYEAKLLT